ncbi:TetR family transcriptional regulator [Conexibacter sp. CPCC 206217]|uniref:TetR family transcriptional regulator n=1 Tax=Conexibacter sp. CPCC 206217 TaxID=3064574 RepID=UPI0027288236|nr:TetR family transcriptional regulator [Conexibacter sp. CPCC 206217]MDO8211640.1 TetR family transcriptional regulator [Conexibacter sp. CPCC 206217]
MARDSAATRARILDAAIDEFSEHGLAGARIDRIAAASGANKRSIYVYYESKELLFRAVMQRAIAETVEAVPLTVDDLPGYAGRLFDHILAHPKAFRLELWLKLERPAVGADEAAAAYAEKLATMTDAGGTAANGIAAADLLMLVIGLTRGWFLASDALLAAAGDDDGEASPERVAAHRAALVEAARRISAPLV